MRKILFVTVQLFVSTILLAQNEDGNQLPQRPLNSISLNMLGDASAFSIQYERLFTVTSNLFLSGKLGLGYNEEFIFCFFSPCTPEKYLTLPHHITGNIGSGRNFFEFGFGGTILYGNTTEPYFFYPMAGYRLIPLSKNKLNFRILLQVPVTGFNGHDILFSPIDLSLGFCF
ncbi:MAG: hypothetical protein R3C61_08265 [Bacteroidia bacterium]